MSEVPKTFKIIVGYDGSDAARRGLLRAAQLGVEAATILVVAVRPEMLSAGLGSPLASEAIDRERLLGEARELLGVMQRTEVETRAAAGDPAVVLVDAARVVA